MPLSERLSARLSARVLALSCRRSLRALPGRPSAPRSAAAAAPSLRSLWPAPSWGFLWVGVALSAVVVEIPGPLWALAGSLAEAPCPSRDSPLLFYFLKLEQLLTSTTILIPLLY